MNAWSILYRGPLSSCNYGCDYCPFAKTTNTRAELRDDEEKLVRFVDWVEGRPESIGVLFTPWGEALFHRAYQQAITRLSHLPNVRRVSIQTNLSAQLGWRVARRGGSRSGRPFTRPRRRVENSSRSAPSWTASASHTASGWWD